MNKPVITVGITGGSASGKTTLAEKLHAATPNRSRIVSQDSFYINHHDFPDHIRDPPNFDHPDAIEFSEFATAIETLRSGRAATIPVYDFATHLRTEKEVIEPAELLIIEGLFVLQIDQVREQLAFSVFVDVPSETRYQRRLERDVAQRGRTAESVKEQWDSTVAPMFEQFVAPSKTYADIICDGDDYAADVNRILDRMGMDQDK